MIRRLLLAFLPFAPATLAMGAAAQGQEPSHPPELVALATELRQWQRDQPAGVPDFAEQAEKRKRELPEFRQRLHRLNARNWPVHAQVDYFMLQAELDALDFRLNVIRETSKNPDFYLSQAVSRVTRHIGGRFQRAPEVTVPYDADRAAAIVQALTEIEAIVSQASRALSGAVPELADVAIERTNGVRENCAELARVVGQHLPEPYASQIGPAAKRAAEALVQYREWLRDNRSRMTGSYVVGRPAFEWYVQRVMMFPYDSDQLLMQAEMERSRNWAFLQFERQKNRRLPHPGKMFTVAPLRRAATNQEYSEWKDATDVGSRLWAEKQDLFTHPDELGPMRHGQGGIWIEPFGLMAFPEEPLPPGSYAQFVVEPDHWWAHSYWIMGHRRDPGDNHPHNEYPGHRFETTVSQKNTCSLRRGHRTHAWGLLVFLRRGDAAPARLSLRSGSQGTGAHVRSRHHARRAGSRSGEHGPRIDGPEQVEEYMMASVPWMEPYVAKKHEVWRKLVRPASVLYYQVGKYEIYKLLRDRMRQLGDDFDLRAFHDALLATGQIPVSLARLDMTGTNEEIDYLWDWKPIPELPERRSAGR